MDIDEFNAALDYLLLTLEGRVNPTHLEQYREYRDVGEETLAVDSIACAIHEDGIPLSRKEFEKLKYLLYAIKGPTKWEPYIQRRDEIMESVKIIGEA